MSPSTVITIMGLLLHSFYFDDSPSSSWLSETPVAESKITIDFLKILCLLPAGLTCLWRFISVICPLSSVETHLNSRKEQLRYKEANGSELHIKVRQTCCQY